MELVTMCVSGLGTVSPTYGGVDNTLHLRRPAQPGAAGLHGGRASLWCITTWRAGGMKGFLLNNATGLKEKLI